MHTSLSSEDTLTPLILQCKEEKDFPPTPPSPVKLGPPRPGVYGKEGCVRCYWALRRPLFHRSAPYPRHSQNVFCTPGSTARNQPGLN